MKKYAIIISLFIIVGVASLVQTDVISYQTGETGDTEKVLSEQKQNEVDGMRQPTWESGDDDKNVNTTTSTESISNNLNIILDQFIYPGSEKINFENSSYELTSTDDVELITSWYEEKIRALGLNIKSFVRTSANDKVLNKLSGADSEKEINVEIEKGADSNRSTITIEVES